MRRFGVHTSIAGGLDEALRRAHALGCTAMQIFSHNPRGWLVREITSEEAARFIDLQQQFDIAPVFIHTSYLLNIASPDESLRTRSAAMMADELRRADRIGADYVVLHTGTAHDGDGIKRAAQSITAALGKESFKAGLLLENTSGKRGDTTSRIADLGALITATGSLVAGVCIDTAHAFAAGYDLTKDNGAGELAEEIQAHMGTHRIKLIHLNDSKVACGSGNDRHEHLGAGMIGARALKRFLAHPAFSEVPLILETPKKSDDDDRANIKQLKNLIA